MLKSITEETVENDDVPIFFSFLLTEHLLFLQRSEIIYPVSWWVTNTENFNTEKDDCFQAKWARAGPLQVPAIDQHSETLVVSQL